MSLVGSFFIRAKDPILKTHMYTCRILTETPQKATRKALSSEPGNFLSRSPNPKRNQQPGEGTIQLGEEVSFDARQGHPPWTSSRIPVKGSIGFYTRVPFKGLGSRVCLKDHGTQVATRVTLCGFPASSTSPRGPFFLLCVVTWRSSGWLLGL